MEINTSISLFYNKYHITSKNIEKMKKYFLMSTTNSTMNLIEFILCCISMI